MTALGATKHPLPRWTAWLLVVMAGIVLLYGVDLVFGVFPAGASDLFQKFASCATFFGAAVVCVLRGRASPHERGAWRLFGLALGLWGLGSIYYSAFLWNLAAPPIPSPADAFWIVFYLPAYAGIYGLLRTRTGSFGKAARLDAVIGGLGVGGASALLVFGAVVETAHGDALAVATNLAYPLGDLGLVVLVVAAMTAVGWKNSGVLRWIAPAFFLFAIVDSIYLVNVANGTYAGGLLDAGWPAAALLAGLAAYHDELPTRVAPRKDTLLAVPAIVGLGAVTLLVVDHYARADALPLALATTSLLVILVRLHLSVHDNARLLRRSQVEATTDALTGLGNRRQLVADLAHHVDHLDPQRPLVLTIFDLDGFKSYNDTFGHWAGDQLLERLGNRLGALVAGAGTAYRMGGDEFCTLWQRSAELTTDAAVAALSEAGEAFTIGCSHGSVLLPIETTDPVEALKLADRNMYLRKRRGRTSAGRQSADVLQRALAERMPELDVHLGGVADLATMTAARLGVSPDDLELTRQTALLHDVGKVAIPDDILNKPGPLDDAELGLMRRHTIIGERIISAAPALAAVADLVRATHEAYDGRGYPDGLAGEAIPLIARIVAVSDAYDAMTSDRAYRAAMDMSGAVAELRRCSGTQFDPRVVTALVGVVESAVALSASSPRILQPDGRDGERPARR
jgi:diguanylate cyclase (GGDEF)-like protein